VFTFALRLAGYQGRVEIKFPPVELRPALELEPQRTMMASRLQTELSLGTITDIEYHMQMFGRPPPPGAPQLSGTGFMNPVQASVDTQGVSPNGNSLDRSMTSPGSQNARSSAVKKPGGKAKN